ASSPRIGPGTPMGACLWVPAYGAARAWGVTPAQKKVPPQGMLSIRQFGAVLLLWLCGVALRLTVLAMPAVIALVKADLDLSATAVGIVTGLPVALFAIAAVPGSLLISRVGAVSALISGLLITAIASALRALASETSVLYATTTLMGFGVAIMQPALPHLV